MKISSLEKMIKNKKVKKAVLKIFDFEQSQLHKERPRYKSTYEKIIKGVIIENKKNNSK